jgi:hypothetical protein
MKKLLFSIIYLVLLFKSISIYAQEYHVSPVGNDNYEGNIKKPFKTIQNAVRKMAPGATCIIHNGTYREKISITVSGTESAPIVLQAANGEKPILSGLDELNLKWKSTDRKGIYVADFNSKSEFEQLFIDGKPLLEARWPNVPKNKYGDWDFFSPKVWATVDSIGNSYGTVKDKDLATTGWDATGALAVLNIQHQFFVWSRKVEEHSLGNTTFKYLKNLGNSVKDIDESGGNISFNDDRYYLVGKKEFLDSPGEWYYDSIKNQLYIFAPNDKNIQKCHLEIKTRNYSLIAGSNINYITVDGLTFFGTAFSFGKDYNNKSKNIIFKNNEIYYSSWTEHYSISKDDPKEKYYNNFPTIDADSSIVSNCIFANGALSALFINGNSNQIENNVFHDFNLNSSLGFPPLQISKPWEAMVGKATKASVRFNSIYNSGGILIQVAQSDNDVYMNDLHDAFKSCWGGNKDVSALYTQNIFCHGTRLHHNWVREGYAGTPMHRWGGGMGIRGDDKTAGLTIDHNVIWNIGSAGIELKNPNNPTLEMANGVFNNTIFQHSKYNTIKSGMIIETNNNHNQFSSIVNNLCESIYGHWFAKPLGTVANYSNNICDFAVETLLESPKNFDFRPKKNVTEIVDKGKIINGITSSTVGSLPDIGAYELGESVYWIPGRRERTASFPIVPDGAEVSSERDILMWKPAFKAISQQIYFGTNSNKMELKATLTVDQNIFKLTELAKGTKYWWRIDSIMTDNTIEKGETWYFKTIK